MEEKKFLASMKRIEMSYTSPGVYSTSSGSKLINTLIPSEKSAKKDISLRLVAVRDGYGALHHGSNGNDEGEHGNPEVFETIRRSSIGNRDVAVASSQANPYGEIKRLLNATSAATRTAYNTTNTTSSMIRTKTRTGYGTTSSTSAAGAIGTAAIVGPPRCDLTVTELAAVASQSRYARAIKPSNRKSGTIVITA